MKSHKYPNVSNTVTGVVDGLIAQMQSDGEGLLPLVLALNPQLSAAGLSEADPDFDRRGRAQSDAEMRFFEQVKPALRQAIAAVLTDAISTPRTTFASGPKGGA